MRAGSGSGANNTGPGGQVVISAGHSNRGVGGDMTLEGGTARTRTGGSVTIKSGNSVVSTSGGIVLRLKVVIVLSVQVAALFWLQLIQATMVEVVKWCRINCIGNR